PPRQRRLPSAIVLPANSRLLAVARACYSGSPRCRRCVTETGRSGALMSANGTKQTSRDVCYLSAFGGKADISSDCLPITIYEYTPGRRGGSVAPYIAGAPGKAAA